MRPAAEPLKSVVIGEVFHDILYPALQNVAQPIDGVHFYILIMSQAVKQRSCDIVMGVEVILRNTTLFHGFPKLVILYHEIHLSPLTFLYYEHKMTEIIVSQYRHLQRRKKMNILNAENVYHTLMGDLLDAYVIPGVENAFANGKRCDELYRQIYWANQRLCARLGKTDEDEDVELIINNFLEMNRILCLEMYRYGQVFGGK